MKKIVYLVLIMIVHNFGYAQTMDWKSLPKGVNNSVRGLSNYNGKLIASGGFTLVDSVNINSIAAWDGNNWTALGEGLKGWFTLVKETMVFNNELYVAGYFDTVGLIPAKNIAKWNGTNWSSFGAHCTGEINAIAFLNNELYVAGLFDSIGGIAASRIAKWDGTKWDSLGAGIQGANVFELYPFNNELYVLGIFDSAGNVPCNYIARWDGMKWDSVPFDMSHGTQAMVEYRNNLLIGSQSSFIGSNQYTDIIQWDGQNPSLFSRQQMQEIRTLSVINNQLYTTGLGVLVWDTSASMWKDIGTGLYTINTGRETYALCEYNGQLYCGGGFNKKEGASHNYIARYTDITSVKNHSKNVFSTTVFPIPAGSSFSVEVKSPSAQYPLQFSIYDILGKQVFTTQLLNTVTTINNFEAKGVFSWKVEDVQHLIQTGKLITQ